MNIQLLQWGLFALLIAWCLIAFHILPGFLKLLLLVFVVIGLFVMIDHSYRGEGGDLQQK